LIIYYQIQITFNKFLSQFPLPRIFEGEKEIGLVNKVVPDEELKKATYEMATTIAKLPPTAIQLARRGLYQGLDGDLPTQLQFEAFGLEACVRSADFAEAVSAFMEKREPKFGG